MQPSEMIKMLVSLGLTQYEARVYSALLGSGTCTVSETAFKSGVPRPKVYPTLKALIKRGLVASLPEEPIKCKALPPDIAFSATVSRYEETSRKARRALSELSKAYASAKVAEDLERQELWVLKTRETVQLKLSSLLRDAQEAITFMLDDDGLRAVHEIRDLVRATSTRDVDVRIITQISRTNLPQLADIAEHVEIRHAASSGAENVCLRDETGILFFRRGEDTQSQVSPNLIGIFAENSRLSATWRSIIDRFAWSAGIPYKTIEELLEKDVVYEDLLFRLDRRLLPRLSAQAVAQALTNRLSEENVSEISVAIGGNMLKMLLDVGLTKIVQPSLSESLQTLASLSQFFGESPTKFKYDDVLKMLTTEVPNESFRHNLASRSEERPTPSMWSFLTLGLIDHFGYACRVLKETYDEKRDAWVVQRKLLKKTEAPTQIPEETAIGHLDT